MSNTQERLRNLALHSADILLPKKGVDLSKWAVVACDQYTSEKSYWEQCKTYVGEEPSTLNLIFPEAYLEEAEPEKRIATINEHMANYTKGNLFDTYENCFFLVHRTTDTFEKGRWGLLVLLDLEQYDYSVTSRSLIRATEGTILSRIPPRKQIRKKASLELPHIMVLISDEKRSVIEPLAAKTDRLQRAYETTLMAGGGTLEAWVVDSEEDFSAIADALEVLRDRLNPENPLLYAMGDGNHSLATAKSCWEDIKATLPSDRWDNHPGRYAMVELENIYDPGLAFEPIHRVLFGLSFETFRQEVAKCAEIVIVEQVDDLETLHTLINERSDSQRFGYRDKSGFYLFSLSGAIASIAAGTLQIVIDSLLAQKKATVDYIHGEQVTAALGEKEHNCALILPNVSKETFFDTIIKDNALPRKTFSMGEANEKRYYMEARKIGS
ncbi:DUF1015 domain-containing protein [Sphaerochaeta sp. PS]|uniref:DUF1015 domain-containing protein n=1 Tax=Sphaerochaeta sp. PS TaxID=3076336 RepID=UPI0028A34B60|nr:DUF1015 domain-containing protein [Sphaerochaeta sp. PS]MDT4761434.1 DUF1015 domain-containing protein [Sphaerochaeta sp. PS]